MPDIGNLTPADVLTPAGFVTTAALVYGFVQLLQRFVAIVRGNEQAAAALTTIVIVALALASQASLNPPADFAGWVSWGFVGFLSWYGILRIAMGLHDDVAQKPNSLTGPTGEG